VPSELDYFLNTPELELKSSAFQYETFQLTTEISSRKNIDFSPNLMLGKQAEALFEQAIIASARYKLLSSNIQVQGATETLGELDYILFDTQTSETYHVELACKFYLFDDSISGSKEQKWIGPNRKDSLYEKMTKMQTKQFPLLYKKETKQLLNKLGITTSGIIQKTCVKAFLFTPKVYNNDSLSENYKNCLSGYWITYAAFLAEEQNAPYLLPDKKQWLQSPETFIGWSTFSEVKTAVEQLIAIKKSPLVYKKTPEGILKFFVVWWN